jgi:CheY-like chemotaxis protein
MPEAGAGNSPIYAPLEPPALPPNAKRVLVMDDEAPICELAVELLGREGYYVGTASDGREAIRCYVQAQQKGRPYDVVILDLTVRDGMGGREAVKELKKIDPDVRAIVSSGYSQDPTISRFREFGFCGVVSKPYSVAEMTQEIEQAIADRNSASQPAS